MKNIEDYRQSYEKDTLVETALRDQPLAQFEDWFKTAEACEDILEVNAMTLSTLGKDGFPKSRVVLLKEFSQEGFIFYTNYTSEKAESIAYNPKVCMSFFWPPLERQIIIKGTVEKVSEEKSQAYFNSRPRGSQLGAWASHQSSMVASRKVIEERLQKLKTKFEDKPIPKPDFWGGFLIKPETFEFWQGRPNRLHDRILYTNTNNTWSHRRLEP